MKTEKKPNAFTMKPDLSKWFKGGQFAAKASKNGTARAEKHGVGITTFSRAKPITITSSQGRKRSGCSTSGASVDICGPSQRPARAQLA